MKRKSGKANGGVSLCMIVKNEEARLPTCLESVKGIVDEMVVVDTGSSDATAAVAGRYGAKVVHMEWKDDFSAARNESLKYATGEWVLYLDADECFAPRQQRKLERLLSRHDVDAYTLVVEGDHRLADGIVHQVNAYPRLFRRDPAVRFEGRVHEQVTPSLLRAGKRIVPSDLVIHHSGYSGSMEEIRMKCERNLNLLRRQLAEEPLNSYVRFQVGNTLTVLGRYGEAERELQTAASSPDLSAAVKASVFNLLAEIEIRRDRFSAAMALSKQSLHVAPRQQMARWFLASAAIAAGEIEEAVQPLRELLVLADSLSPQIASDAAYDIALRKPFVEFRLGECYRQLGLYEEASEAYVGVLKATPDHREAFVGLLDCHDAMRNPQRAIRQLLDLPRIPAFDVERRIALAANHLRMNDVPPARSILDELKSEGVATYEFHKLSVQAAMAELDFTSAIVHLEAMARLVPEVRSSVQSRLERLAAVVGARASSQAALPSDS